MSAPDDRPPGSGDASHFDFDDLVLDENFVRAATINEDTATARLARRRQQQARRSHRFPRPHVRRARRSWQRWLHAKDGRIRPRPAPEAPRLREWNAAQWAAAVVAVALAATFVWALTASHSKAHTAAVANPVAATAPKGADPAGTCRGLQTAGGRVAPSRVNCNETHSVQATGYYYRLATRSPDASTVAEIQSACRTGAIIFAGGQLPSYVHSGYLLPSQTQWSAGDHDAECTIYEVDSSGALRPNSDGTLQDSED